MTTTRSLTIAPRANVTDAEERAIDVSKERHVFTLKINFALLHDRLESRAIRRRSQIRFSNPGNARSCHIGYARALLENETCDDRVAGMLTSLTDEDVSRWKRDGAAPRILLLVVWLDGGLGERAGRGLILQHKDEENHRL